MVRLEWLRYGYQLIMYYKTNQRECYCVCIVRNEFSLFTMGRECSVHQRKCKIYVKFGLETIKGLDVQENLNREWEQYRGTYQIHRSKCAESFPSDRHRNLLPYYLIILTFRQIFLYFFIILPSSTYSFQVQRFNVALDYTQ